MMNSFDHYWYQILNFAWLHPFWFITGLITVLVLVRAPWRSRRDSGVRSVNVTESRNAWPVHSPPSLNPVVSVSVSGAYDSADFHRHVPSISQYRERDEIEELLDRLDRVRNTKYRARELLNTVERKIFYAAKGAIRDAGLAHRFLLFPQIPLGAFLKDDDKQAYNDIAALRPDFVITDTRMRPVIVIEYHGSGHELRGEEKTGYYDEMKRAALNAAGVELRVLDDITPFRFSMEWIIETLQETPSAARKA
jgi:hypothetical protein